MLRLISDRARRSAGTARPRPEAEIHPRRCAPRVAARRVLPSLRPVRLGGASPRRRTRRTWYGDPAKIYRAAVSEQAPGPRRSSPRPGEEVDGLRGRPARRGRRSWCSSPHGRRVRPLDPARDRRERRSADPTASSCSATCGTTGKASAPPSTTAARPARWTRAPGSSAPAWPASPRSPSPSCSPAASSQDPQRKTLLFNDSVQDAAHRAGFVASRSYSFSLRTLLAAILDTTPGRQAIAERPDRRRDHQRERPASGCPPSSRPTCTAAPDVDALLAGETSGDDGHLAADRRAARVPGGPGVRAPVPAGPHPGAHPDRRRRGRRSTTRRGSPPSPGTCRSAGPVHR